MDSNFQTLPHIFTYMASFVANGAYILEPTKGIGNLVKALELKGTVYAPRDFFSMPHQRFDWIVANPPFSPMQQGYDILYQCMEMSDHLIFLLPWLSLINSSKRTQAIKKFGLKSVTHLPRNAFQGSRVQTCILEMAKDYKGKTDLLFYDLLETEGQ